MGFMKKIIVLHGWTRDLNKWRRFAELLEDSGYRVEILKIPGLTKKSNKIWDLENYVKWLKSKIRTDNKGTILLGHSNGGRIAIAFAAKYPDQVKHLILIDSAGIFHNNLPIRIKRSFFKKAALLGKQIPTLSKFKWLLYKLAREHDYEKASPNMKRTLVNLISADLTPVLKSIESPTLIVWGKKDKTTPLSDAFLMKEKIKNSKLEIIEGASHSPFFSHPKETARQVLKELRKP